MTLGRARFSTMFVVTTLCAVSSQAAVITFDHIEIGQTSFTVDADGDSVDDVRFQTNDPFGFSSVGPGLRQSYIDEPGLEGTTVLNPDMRVEFLNGARNAISFGFALNASRSDPLFFASLRLFSNDNALIAARTVPSSFTTLPNGQSSFPEGLFTVSFVGVASYGLLDFQSENGRFIIDSFQGDFGSVEGTSPVPEPASLALVGLILFWLYAVRYRSRAKP